MIPYHYATFHTPVFKCPAAFQSLDPTTQASRLHFNGKIEEQLHFSLQQKTNEKKARNFCAKSLASFYWFAQSRFNSWSYQRLIVRSSHKLTKKLSFKTLMMNRSKTILEGRKKMECALGIFAVCVSIWLKRQPLLYFLSETIGIESKIMKVPHICSLLKNERERRLQPISQKIKFQGVESPIVID